MFPPWTHLPPWAPWAGFWANFEGLKAQTPCNVGYVTWAQVLGHGSGFRGGAQQLWGASTPYFHPTVRHAPDY